MSDPGWVGEAEQRLADVFTRVSPKAFAGPPTYRVTWDLAYEVAEANLRWAIWCVESLYELRDLIDLDDARGDNLTPLGHRTNPLAMGARHVGVCDRDGGAGPGRGSVRRAAPGCEG